MLLRVLSVVVVAGAALAAVSGSEVASQSKPLDFETFKSRVEPIFLELREGHVRCYTCHSENNSAFHLERLPAGSNFWSDEQSRKNFQSVSGLVVPNDPAKSRLLIHPLAPEAGGDLFHSGGRQFGGRPGLKILAQWASANYRHRRDRGALGRPRAPPAAGARRRPTSFRRVGKVRPLTAHNNRPAEAFCHPRKIGWAAR